MIPSVFQCESYNYFSDWQDEFSSDVEPSPRDLPPPASETLSSPVLAKEPTPKHDVASPRQSEEEADETASV